jgi:hypothetical protein
LEPLESYLGVIQTTQQVITRLEPQPEKKPRGRRTKKEAAPPPVDTALEAMRGSQLTILESLADELPAVWNSVGSPVFRRAFSLAIAAS